eukprot:2393931-Amphidinium_carterae.2
MAGRCSQLSMSLLPLEACQNGKGRTISARQTGAPLTPIQVAAEKAFKGIAEQWLKLLARHVGFNYESVGGAPAQQNRAAHPTYSARLQWCNKCCCQMTKEMCKAGQMRFSASTLPTHKCTHTWLHDVKKASVRTSSRAAQTQQADRANQHTPLAKSQNTSPKHSYLQSAVNKDDKILILSQEHGRQRKAPHQRRKCCAS